MAASIKRLWTRTNPSTTRAIYKIKKGYLAPKRIQYPYPAIMNAARRSRADYAVKHCDCVTVSARRPRRLRARAGLPHAGRRAYAATSVWTLVNIVQAENRDGGARFYNDYVHQRGDWDRRQEYGRDFLMDAKSANAAGAD